MQQVDPVATGTISGQIADKSGAAIVGAHVTLKLDGQPATQEAVADSNGQFTFTNIPPGPFQLQFLRPVSPRKHFPACCMRAKWTSSR